MPNYWLNEQSGILKEAVEAFFSDEDMSSEDIEILKAYISQWLEPPMLIPANERVRLKDELSQITTKKGLKEFHWQLVNEYFIDCF